MDTLLLSKQEAARMLGISVRSLEHLISRQEIQTRRTGRRVLIGRATVESFAYARSSDDHDANEAYTSHEHPKPNSQE